MAGFSAIIGFLFFVFILFFLANVIDFMKKTILQREAQIDQMDRFLELYKKVNGLNSSIKDDK